VLDPYRPPPNDGRAPEVVRLSAALHAGDPEAADRLDAGHHPCPDGSCSGHTDVRRAYPCHAVQVAAEIRRQQEEAIRAAHDMYR
jgi:hypothetical protein